MPHPEIQDVKENGKGEVKKSEEKREGTKGRGGKKKEWKRMRKEDKKKRT